MPPPSTPKLEVATELLSSALALYYQGGADFAALHLAGGAEELLAKHLSAKGQESAFESLRNAAIRFSKYFNEDGKESTPKAIANVMYHAKNSTKHMDGASDSEVQFDARSEAHKLLDRAVTNYYALMQNNDLKETELIGRFNRELGAGA